MRRAPGARRSGTIVPGRISCPGGLLGAAALILTLAGCGDRIEADQQGGIVVVSGAGQSQSPGNQAAGTALASASADPTSSAFMPVADAAQPMDDAAQEAALTAVREADPYRLGGVDPELLAQAGAAG